MYDITIIGAGPAGLTAAIYAARAEKRVLLLEKGTFGGQITFSPKVENYPGVPSTSGNELAEHMLEQVMALGVDIELCRVNCVSDIGEFKIVKTTGGDYTTKSVIIATGAKHRKLGLPGEEELTGEGVSYCAVCDGAFFKGKSVVVIGGGNTAIQDALLLSEGCTRVIMIQNLSSLTGEVRTADLLRKRENVSFMFDTVVTGFIGKNTLSGVKVKNVNTGEENEIHAEGAFVAIGQEPENEPFSKLVPLDKFGYIVSGEDCTTSSAGVFVAGDCRTKAIRQVTTATADGAVAALAAIKYVNAI